MACQSIKTWGAAARDQLNETSLRNQLVAMLALHKLLLSLPTRNMSYVRFYVSFLI